MFLSDEQLTLLRSQVEGDGAFRLRDIGTQEGYLLLVLELTDPDGEVYLPPILDGFDIEALSTRKGQVRLSAPASEVVETLRMFALLEAPAWRRSFEQMVSSDTGCPAKVVASNQFEVAFDLELPRLSDSVRIPDYVIVDEIDLQGGKVLCHSDGPTVSTLVTAASPTVGLPVGVPQGVPGKSKKKLLN